ncbi:MAG TPA: gluconokinase [Acidimicrobiales bacterium]|nr:gluconokinase [Acidimicrobiales bacterium]
MKSESFPRCVIVMGVSGSGKSTVARRMAEAWGDHYVESDDLHSTGDIEKMSAGIPLDDEDRRPWLHAIGELLRADAQQGRSSVTACSALKRSYRDILRSYVPTAFFVELDGPIDLIRSRLMNRHHAFMAPSLLESQFAALEPLQDDERGIRVDAELPVETIMMRAEEALSCVPRVATDR